MKLHASVPNGHPNRIDVLRSLWDWLILVRDFSYYNKVCKIKSYLKI